MSSAGFDRAAMFAALGEPVRLALVDRLVAGDASPTALAAELGVGSNLMAHHLGVLEDAGVIRRVRSEGDGRRSYIQLRLDNPTVRYAALTSAMGDLLASRDVRRVVFVCTANSARSQLAAATWNTLSDAAGHLGRHPSRGERPPSRRECRPPPRVGPYPRRADRPGRPLGHDRPGGGGLRQRPRGARSEPASAALVGSRSCPGRHRRRL